MVERLNNAQNHKRAALKKIAKLSKIVAVSIEQKVATLGDENHNIVNEILNETIILKLKAHNIVNETPHTFAEELPLPAQFLLWQQQQGGNLQKRKPWKAATHFDHQIMLEYLPHTPSSI